MKIKEAVNHLEEGTKRYKLIVANQDSMDCVKECELLDIPNIVKLNMDKVLLEILEDKNDNERKFDSWDILLDFFNSINAELLVIYNVDYMFTPELGNHDIIKNFSYLSRTRKILLFVKGKVLGNNLIHSEEGFEDYKNMDVSEVIITGW